MTYYRYNALDIAAYIKWTGIPADTERMYLDLLFQMREQILARPLAKDFESFTQAVFREMYHVWARGFENEFSDVNLIAPEGSAALFCDQEFLALESYMKLLSLHLILTENLPYVRINFVGLPLLIGIEGEFSEFEKNLGVAAEMLRLVTTDDRGNNINLVHGIPSEPICLGLQSEFRKALFGSGGYRIRRSNDYQEKMRLLREKSRREQEVREILRSGTDSRRDHKGFLPGIPIYFTGSAPTGAITATGAPADQSEPVEAIEAVEPAPLQVPVSEPAAMPDPVSEPIVIPDPVSEPIAIPAGNPEVPEVPLHSSEDAAASPKEPAASGDGAVPSKLNTKTKKKR